MKLRRPILLLVLAAAAVSVYLLASYWQNGRFGFPLDDAWIHQVYARNLGTRLEFSFQVGEPSAGSTSPLWAILLGIGYALHIDFRLWTIGLGVLFGAAAAWTAGRAAGYLTPVARTARWFVPLLLIFEWHMVWAAASGMEITLFVFLSLLLVERFWAKAPVAVLGLVGGLLTLTRPEGVLLTGLVGLAFGLRALRGDERNAAQLLQKAMWFGAAFLVVLAPYLWFNWQTSRTLLPNTFYAKSGEYAFLTTQANVLVRWVWLYRQPLIGAQLLLVPGLLYFAWQWGRERKWDVLLPALWILALPLLYAWRLPVDYQFGRYVMPIIPFIVLYGAVGTSVLLPQLGLRVLRRAWALTIGVLLVVFFTLGANLYAQSVGIIECEMVAVAQWTRANVPPGELIAAHDIGAQGYFDDHPLLDMAGLVSPEVIPFIRDEAQLQEWVMARGARYVVFFPTWYPKLAAEANWRSVYSTGCAATRAAGESNLQVYEVR